MRPARAALTIVALASLLPAATLHAQPAAKPIPKAPPTASAKPTASAAPAAANDIVRLKSGTIFRGALVEHDPKGRTLLQTDAGTRDFDSNDVAYAGPAAGDTGPGGAAPPVPVPPPATSAAPPAATTSPVAPPPVTAAPSAAPAVTGDVVQLNATSPGLQFHVLAAPPTAGAARPLCVAPCSTQLPAGIYRMALSKDGDSPREVNQDVPVRANGTLEASYVSKKPARVVGVLVLVASGLVGLGSLAAAGSSDADSKSLGGLGILAASGGIFGGIVLVKTKDQMSIRSAEADRVIPRAAFSSGEAAPAVIPRLGGQF